MRTTLTPHIRACADKAMVGALGKPWAPLGRGPNSFDCWGFVVYVYKAAGIQLPSCAMPDPCYDIQAAARGTGIQVEKAVPRTPYSIALMGKMGVYAHVGIYHPSGIIYHCLDRQGVSAGWRARFTRLSIHDIRRWLNSGYVNKDACLISLVIPRTHPAVTNL